MGMKYHHLTEKDRIFLRVMLERRYPKNKIAEILGVHRSTIYRELKRNSFKHWRHEIFRQNLKRSATTRVCF